ncbi:MAG: MraY family glycosyltransferase, partial [Bacteroidota bacterium]
INAFNLIDGINGLSGGLATLIFSVFGTWFFLAGRPELSVVAFATVGAVVAFLKYNITPAAIFMGDTGSLLLGLICSILSIEFIEFHQSSELQSVYAFQSVPAVTIGIIIIPLFDTLRVFTMRMLKGKSPFQPDRTHIHHLLIDSGLTHTQASTTLVLVNIIFICIVFFFQHIGTLPLILLILGLALLASSWLYWKVQQKQGAAS